MDIDKAKDTIRRLLNLANDDSASQGEIDNAMRFAARLMEQHQLSDGDLSEIDDKLLDLERSEFTSEGAYFGGATRSQWEAHAASFVCLLVGGVKWYMTNPTAVRNSAGILQLSRTGQPMVKPMAVFYGVAEDVEIARQLWAELMVTVAAMARLKWGSVYRGSGRCYCDGFVQGLFDRYYEDRRTAKIAAQQAVDSGSDFRAMVVIDNRTAIVDRKAELATKWLAGKGIALVAARSWRRASFSNDDAYSDGQSDGKRHSPSADRRKKIGCN